jgi:hypothetical protein
VGTVSNSGPFELHDVAVYASAHDKDKKQVDSVVSNIIPNLKPGQQVAFTADPNSEGKIIYYSCAGVDLNPQMQKLTIGNNKVLHYDFEGLVAIIDLKYDNSSDSMVFGVKHYNPDGGHMAIKMASKEYSGSENPLSLMLDGKDLTIDGTATTNDNGDVLTMDFVVPPKEHKIQIGGINDLAS